MWRDEFTNFVKFANTVLATSSLQSSKTDYTEYLKLHPLLTPLGRDNTFSQRLAIFHVLIILHQSKFWRVKLDEFANFEVCQGRFDNFS